METTQNLAGRPLIPPTPSIPLSTTTETCNKYLITKVTLYQLEDIRDKLLWETFCDDFGGWTMNEFINCDKITL